MHTVLSVLIFSQNLYIFQKWMLPIILHTALLNGLHYVDQYRYLAPATADEFLAHCGAARNATLLPVLPRPNQIHAAVMPICLLLLVGRPCQTSHSLRYSSDGSLGGGVLLLKVFSLSDSCHIYSTFACYSRNNSAARTPELLLGRLLVAVGFAPFNFEWLYRDSREVFGEKCLKDLLPLASSLGGL